jgi:hypothetical protein
MDSEAELLAFLIRFMFPCLHLCNLSYLHVVQYGILKQ